MVERFLGDQNVLILPHWCNIHQLNLCSERTCGRSKRLGACVPSAQLGSQRSEMLCRYVRCVVGFRSASGSLPCLSDVSIKPNICWAWWKLLNIGTRRFGRCAPVAPIRSLVLAGAPFSVEAQEVYANSSCAPRLLPSGCGRAWMS
eukprot:13091683-Alexandrium_andersonii.AAC.2